MSPARLFVAAGVLFATSGCAQITSNQNATQAVSGELWYVKQRALFGLVFSSKVFHCAPPSSGSAKCKEATVAAGASLSELANSAAADTGDAANKADKDAAAASKDADKTLNDKDKKDKDKKDDKKDDKKKK